MNETPLTAVAIAAALLAVAAFLWSPLWRYRIRWAIIGLALIAATTTLYYET
ncbi:hypothetical protein [Natronoglycomyces albus]|uniref:Uncharacterized protein n=1 Tax=Natronoglycomyces albus TaxID=2811108 RepID=A0A895XRC1_9ACTN|nr:hypothetical protein [Natronoglycomyces albus]QSB06262.1 hypothetical protein JQS30_04965 [Natronoglycomyces albus]